MNFTKSSAIVSRTVILLSFFSVSYKLIEGYVLHQFPTNPKLTPINLFIYFPLVHWLISPVNSSDQRVFQPPPPLPKHTNTRTHTNTPRNRLGVKTTSYCYVVRKSWCTFLIIYQCLRQLYFIYSVLL